MEEYRRTLCEDRQYPFTYNLSSGSMDIVDANTRSRMMANIGSKNTLPEITVRRYLHGLGYRFRLHRTDLPGRPDLALPKYKLAIFVNGCFWHRHNNCFYATSPATRKEYWQEKLNRNTERDTLHIKLLIESGWRVLTVWECGLKHNMDSIDSLPEMIESKLPICEWPATPPRLRSDY
nr:very short patch repair endonuclease [Pseudomonas sp. CCI1.4]